MHSILGNQLPVFSPEEKRLIKGSLDFIGINHYGSLYAKDCSLSACSQGADHPITGFVETTGIRDGIPIGDQVPLFCPRLLFSSCYVFFSSILLLFYVVNSNV